MKAFRTTFALAALLIIASGPALGEDETLIRQCYRRPNEPLDGCTICVGTCLGEGYLCCEYHG